MQRAALDTILLASWGALIICGAFWALCTIVPESTLLGNHGELFGRILVTGFPLLSAYRVQRNYQVPRAGLWAFGLWFFSVLFLVSYFEQRVAVQQNALILASLLFIALPVPMMRVWGELRNALWA